MRNPTRLISHWQSWRKKESFWGIVTQNIDGLHQLAGSKNVCELHGSVLRNRCMECGERHDLAYIMDEANCVNGVPKCKVCGKTVKPDVVLYEESLEEHVLKQAVDWISEADCLIVGGTSLVVYPAAGLINYFNGHDLILINKSETSYDDRATLGHQRLHRQGAGRLIVSNRNDGS